MNNKKSLFYFVLLTISLAAPTVFITFLMQSQGKTKADRTILQNGSVYEFETNRGDYCVLVSKSTAWGALQCDFKGGSDGEL